MADKPVKFLANKNIKYYVRDSRIGKRIKGKSNSDVKVGYAGYVDGYTGIIHSGTILAVFHRVKSDWANDSDSFDGTFYLIRGAVDDDTENTLAIVSASDVQIQNGGVKPH